jgi:predicted dehydrogenase
VQIGFQWSYSRSVRALKRDLVAGKFGRLNSCKTFYLWPRDNAYYKRNDWAGKLRDGQGRWILDSPANNAMAHDLHNLLFLSGPSMEKSAGPVSITAEAFRGYAIENYDSLVCKIETGSHVEIFAAFSHAAADKAGPRFVLECEEAVIRYDEKSDEIIARSRTGSELRYGSPFETNQFHKLSVAVRRVRRMEENPCSLEAALPQVLCINGIQDSLESIAVLPDSEIVRDRSAGSVWIRGLAECFTACYSEACLPSELDWKWAVPGKKIDLASYTQFPQSRMQDFKQ